MGIFSYLFDHDWFQRADLNRLDEKADLIETRLEADRASSDNVRGEVRELRRDLSRMLLTIETLQRVLADKRICGNEEFVKRMRAIDAEDGVVDGHLENASPGAEELRYCQGCQHFNPGHLKTCQYCGRSFGIPRSGV